VTAPGVGDAVEAMNTAKSLMLAVHNDDREGLRLLIGQLGDAGELPGITRCLLGLCATLSRPCPSGALFHVPDIPAVRPPRTAPRTAHQAARAAVRLVHDPLLADRLGRRELSPAVAVLADIAHAMWQAGFGADCGASLQWPVTEQDVIRG
jgi:hypothetical protein